MIDITKKYQTRDGRPVVLFADNNHDPKYPILGATIRDGRLEARTWTLEGRYLSPASGCSIFANFDLVPAPIVHTFTLNNNLNVYLEGERILVTNEGRARNVTYFGQLRVKIAGTITDGVLAAEAKCDVIPPLPVSFGER